MRSSWMALWVAFGCTSKTPEPSDSGSIEPAAIDTNEADSGTSSADDTGEPKPDEVIACDEPQFELVSIWTGDSLYESTPAEDWRQCVVLPQPTWPTRPLQIPATLAPHVQDHRLQIP